MRSEKAVQSPRVNQRALRAVPLALGNGRDATWSERAARPAPRGTMGRSVTLSLCLHSVLLVAGLTGGAAYARRGGAESREAAPEESLIVFAAAPRPSPPDAFVAPSAEPEHALDRPADPDQPTLVSQPADMLADQPLASASEVLGSLGSAGGAPSTDIGELLGDPRASFRLPSQSLPGLAIGPAVPPQVAECCGEPQPAPGKPAEAEVYVYPEVVKMVRAAYPAKSQRCGDQGSVLLEMTVGADGLVKDVVVIESSGHGLIDDSAVEAAWGWIFKPATRNGTPEAALARHRYTFRLTSVQG